MKWTLILLLTVLGITLSACEGGERPFMTARVCLGNRDDVAEFTDLFHNIARSRNMEFYDRSEQSLKERKALSSSNSNLRADDFALNISIRDKNGMGVSASDLVGPNYPVAIGFSKGKNQANASQFANGVVDELKEHWIIEVYSDGGAVRPSSTCEKR